MSVAYSYTGCLLLQTKPTRQAFESHRARRFVPLALLRVAIYQLTIVAA